MEGTEVIEKKKPGRPKRVVPEVKTTPDLDVQIGEGTVEAFIDVVPVIAKEEAPIERKVSTKTLPGLKRTIEAFTFTFDENGNVKDRIPFSIEGKPLTFLAATPIKNRKCNWDRQIPWDEDSDPLPDDAWKELPGYDAVYTKHVHRNLLKRILEVFLVRTRDELQLWQIGG